MKHENGNRNIPLQAKKSVRAKMSTNIGWAQVEKVEQKKF